MVDKRKMKINVYFPLPSKCNVVGEGNYQTHLKYKNPKWNWYQ